MATGTNNGKVRTRAQVEQFKQRMEALVRLEAPSMVWAKIRELPIQAVMEKLQQRRLSISGDEETLRVRLFRARCKALPNSNQLDVPWDPETDEEPEQDEKSFERDDTADEKPRDGDRPSAGRWCTTGADGGCVHPADDRGTHGDDKTRNKLGAETFLARLERYRTKGAIPQEDMLFAVDALLVGEAQVWYESVEHKLHSWQDFERRFRRSFANQATPEELLTELRRRTQGKGEDINTYLTNFRYLCSRFREPLPYENQVAIAFRGIRPEYRNFIAHREISSFKELEKAGKEYEKLCRMNAYWHEPVTHANQLHPRAAYKPVQARQCAAVEVSSPKAEGSSNKKSKKRKSPKKKPTSPPRTPPKRRSGGARKKQHKRLNPTDTERDARNGKTRICSRRAVQ
ncbi:unnamed protein product [Trichogramma brassicae]|uniref:Retrotransposon gag domain-containing protein n=1 Tax=Trichogramma brassicae TaxID=86971 RepID=A0A6H5HXL8_9HYME|nr:unnamed protein product [Trichogramma brassicae]